MKIMRQVVVFDAADLAAESTFWAGMLGGRVFTDDDWHSVIDADGRWVIGVQLAPNHLPPEWPNGNPQQIHLDLHVEDFADAHDEAIALGARLLQAADDLTIDEGFQVYADPAGHPFCLGWGQPNEERLRRYVREHS
jgi:hypothetical protein